MAARSGHPRVGGEHASGNGRVQLQHGSSPRGRGTPGARRAALQAQRVIPAWAGNTGVTAGRMATPTGHPRVGGEHWPAPMSNATAIGSSPRGRGTRRRRCRWTWRRRVIPAWAGNTRGWPMGSWRTTGHPRVGGEHVIRLYDVHVRTGSSPRGRGTLAKRDVFLHRLRVIPAWAGNTANASASTRSGTGHPRVGGEHQRHAEQASVLTGSSPRGRGTRGKWVVRCAIDPGHPRVGGEHGEAQRAGGPIAGSSPRGRGTRRARAVDELAVRVIPAWAGNTLPT